MTPGAAASLFSRVYVISIRNEHSIFPAQFRIVHQGIGQNNLAYQIFFRNFFADPRSKALDRNL